LCGYVARVYPEPAASTNSRRPAEDAHEFLADVWGPEYADATPLLRTHIANLRRKLQAGAERPRFIRTDSVIGYRFTA
jgi:DNA-binding response OmpR family regulator